MLESVPQLNPAVRWEQLDTGEILVAYRKDARGFVKLLMRLFAVSGWSQLMLDDIGTEVIRQIDGSKTVRDLIGFVAGEFKLNRKEAEVALVKYLELLGKRNLIGFEVRPVPQEG